MASTRIAELQLVQKMLGLPSPIPLPSELADVVFVCVDCEAFEFAQNKTTEVGVSVLDTRELREVCRFT